MRPAGALFVALWMLSGSSCVASSVDDRASGVGEASAEGGVHREGGLEASLDSGTVAPDGVAPDAPPPMDGSLFDGTVDGTVDGGPDDAGADDPGPSLLRVS